MIVGFTGSRLGMTSAQREAFAAFLENHDVTEFHHGACVGADTEAAAMVPCKPEPHPGQAGTFFRRNREIVDACDLLIGVSGSDVPLDRGGTWYTINYAIKKKKPVRIIWPSGHVTVA